MRRYAFPLVVFVLAFGAAFAGAFAWRDNQNSSEVVSTVSTLPPVETVPPDSTVLTLDTPTTSAPDTTAVPEETVPIITEVQLDEPDLSPSGSFLAAPDLPPLVYDDAGGCAALSEFVDDCEQVAAAGVVLAWVKETDDSGGNVIVWSITGGEGERIATPVLATDGPGLTVRQADVTDDGAVDIVVGRRLGDRTLSVDVISGRGGAPGVVLHLDLENGKAVLGRGQLVSYRAYPREGESVENPSDYQKWVVVPSGDGWRLAENKLVSAGSVGAGQLG